MVWLERHYHSRYQEKKSTKSHRRRKPCSPFGATARKPGGSLRVKTHPPGRSVTLDRRILEPSVTLPKFILRIEGLQFTYMYKGSIHVWIQYCNIGTQNPRKMAQDEPPLKPNFKNWSKVAGGCRLTPPLHSVEFRRRSHG